MTDIVNRLRDTSSVRSWGAADLQRCEAADEITRLRAENESLSKDAERYRWLRVNPVRCAKFADDQIYGRTKHVPELFDAAIDAAMGS